jgi:hypothetical protein
LGVTLSLAAKYLLINDMEASFGSYRVRSGCGSFGRLLLIFKEKILKIET